MGVVLDSLVSSSNSGFKVFSSPICAVCVRFELTARRFTGRESMISARCSFDYNEFSLRSTGSMSSATLGTLADDIIPIDTGAAR